MLHTESKHPTPSNDSKRVASPFPRSQIISFFVFLCVAAMVWLLWSQYKQGEQHTLTQSAEQKGHEVDEPPTIQQGQSEPTPPTKEEVLEVIEKNPKANAMYKAGITSNLKFGFYGRVIDQHGYPVAGATVDVSLLKWRILDAGGEDHKFTTDADGFFEMNGISGQVVTIGDIKKEGYEIKGWESFRTSAIPKTSRQDPYFFYAWKKVEAEPLIYSEGLYGFFRHGESYTFDFYKGKKNEGVDLGDLQITFNRTSDGSRNRPSDWSVVVQPMGGGIIETSSAFMNEAPNEGYMPSWNIAFKKDAPSFKAEVEKHFYVKSRNGKAYSKIKMRFLPYYKDDVDVIEIKAWLNPSGSRNLQYDPKKQIYPK